MTGAYVEQRDGGYWVAGTRVSLDSIVYAFWDGQAAESIAQAFPVLTLEQVYGSIAFEADPMFYRKLADARRQMQTIRR